MASTDVLAVSCAAVGPTVAVFITAVVSSLGSLLLLLLAPHHADGVPAVDGGPAVANSPAFATFLLLLRSCCFAVVPAHWD